MNTERREYINGSDDEPGIVTQNNRSFLKGSQAGVLSSSF